MHEIIKVLLHYPVFRESGKLCSANILLFNNFNSSNMRQNYTQKRKQKHSEAAAFSPS